MNCVPSHTHIPLMFVCTYIYNIERDVQYVMYTFFLCEYYGRTDFQFTTAMNMIK